MRKWPGICTPCCTVPDGIGNTSHQMRGLFEVSGWQSFQVLWSFTFTAHCNGLTGAPEKTYFGSVPRFGSFTVAFGSNTSTIWNGLMWMWNGCAICGP